jgi:hypothetical protein
MEQFKYDVVSFIMMVLWHVCHCLGGKGQNDSFNNIFNHPNVTLFNINATVEENSTNIVQTRFNHSVVDTLYYSNFSGYNISGKGKTKDSGLNYSDDTPLPATILIASPAVAVGIFLFICLAYKWHTVQLDSQAKELAAQVGYGHCPSDCIPCSPCHNSQRLLPPSDSITMNSPCLSENELHGTRRKSLRTPSPVLLSPPNLANHRGSSWSALSDQEVISHSPRRHSTFLL